METSVKNIENDIEVEIMQRITEPGLRDMLVKLASEKIKGTLRRPR